MPRPNEFVTSLNSFTSAFITREEVIQGISSIIPALSSFSSITFGSSPNPLFSTVTLPKTGLIGGYAPIQTSNVIFAATSPVVGAAAQLKLGQVGSPAQSTNALCVADANGNTGVMRAQRFIANVGGTAGYGAGWSFTNAGFTLIDANDNQLAVLTAPIGNSNAIALNNISTINGAPVGQGITTYTTLTGSNINNSGTVTTPAIVSLSSLNGIPLSSYANQQLWVAKTISVSASNVSMTANVPQTIYTVGSLPITAAVGRNINMSIPMSVSHASGGAPSQINVTFTAYIGGNVTNNTGVSATTCLSPGTANSNRLVTISGIAAANGPQNSVQIVAVTDVTTVLSFNIAAYYNQIFFQQIN